MQLSLGLDAKTEFDGDICLKAPFLVAQFIYDRQADISYLLELITSDMRLLSQGCTGQKNTIINDNNNNKTRSEKHKQKRNISLYLLGTGL